MERLCVRHLTEIASQGGEKDGEEYLVFSLAFWRFASERSDGIYCASHGILRSCRRLERALVEGKPFDIRRVLLSLALLLLRIDHGSVVLGKGRAVGAFAHADHRRSFAGQWRLSM